MQGVVVQYVAEQCAAVWCSVLQCVAVCCTGLQCVAVCCGGSNEPNIWNIEDE